MALNGLDSADVNSAFHSALQDSDSWFFLHYTSRDHVALLFHGIGGLDAVRHALAGYNHPSPLYGFFTWHDSRILCNYTPSGTSRLLTARTAVHFQTISDRFEPHRLVLNATSRDDFLDPNLESLCPSVDAAQPISHALEARVASEDEPEISNAIEVIAVATGDAVSQTARDRTTDTDPAHRSHQELDKHAPAQVRTNAYAHAGFLGPLNSHSTELLGFHDLPRPSTAFAVDAPISRPLSMQALSPQRIHTTSTNRDAEVDEYAVLDYRPKVKLFPRPVADTKAKRTSTTTSTQKMPAGTRANWTVKQADQKKLSKSPSTKQRGADVLSRPVRSKTSATDRSAARTFQTSPPLDTDTKKPVAVPVDSSVQEIPSMPSLISPSSFYTIPIQRNLKSHQSTSQMVEKERLMKALQLRRQQMASAAQLHPAPARHNVLADGGLDKADSAVGAECDEDDGREQAPSLSLYALGGNQMNPSINTSARDSVPQLEEQPCPLRDEQGHASQANFDRVMSTSEDEQITLRPRNRVRTAGEAEKRMGRLEPLRIRVSVEVSEADSTVDGSFLEELGQAEMREATPVLISQPSMTAIGTSSPGYRLAETTRPAILARQYSAVVDRSVKLHARQASHETTSPASSDGATSPMESSEPPPIRTLRRSQERAYRLALGEDPFVDKSAIVKRNLSLGISRRIQTLVDVSRRQPKRNTLMSMVSDLDTAGPFLIPQNGSFRSPSDRPGGLATRPATRDGSSVVADNMMVEGMPRRCKTISHLHHPGSSAYFDTTRPRMKDNTFASASKRIESGSRPDFVDESQLRGPANGHDTPRSVNGLDAYVQDQKYDSTHSPINEAPGLHPPRSRGSEVTHDSYDNLAGIHSPSTWSGMVGTDGIGSPSMSERRTSKASRLLKRLSTISASPRTTLGNDTTLHDNSAEQTSSLRAHRATAGIDAQADIVGNLNVLFPDTLAWRRRWVEVDTSGNLSFSNPDTHDQESGMQTLYHMSRFKPPFRAEREDSGYAQHSVVCELADGGGSLRFACQDNVDQAQVLRHLAKLHEAFARSPC